MFKWLKRFIEAGNEQQESVQHSLVATAKHMQRQDEYNRRYSDLIKSLKDKMYTQSFLVWVIQYHKGDGQLKFLCIDEKETEPQLFSTRKDAREYVAELNDDDEYRWRVVRAKVTIQSVPPKATKG